MMLPRGLHLLVVVVGVAAVLLPAVDSTLHLESPRSTVISGTYVLGILPPSLGGAATGPYLVHSDASRGLDLYLFHDGEGGRWYIG